MLRILRGGSRLTKIFKFVIGGGVAAFFNLILIFLLIDGLGFNTPLLRNIANIVSIELSLVLSFFIYRIWVWSGGVWRVREVLLRQLPLYHLSAGVAVISRIFLIFPILDWLKVNYAINTLIGVLVSATLNYFISDRLVFNNSHQYTRDPKWKKLSSDVYIPEGLAPALEDNRPSSGEYYHRLDSSGTVEKFSIVIPAYNEEEGITLTVCSIAETLEEAEINYEILVVNDNSRDQTEAVLKELCTENTKVRYVNNHYPNGFGFAVRCGLENFHGDAVAIVMADSSDHPQNIIDYYHKLQEGYDCVFGSRFIKGGKVIDYPIHKLMINRLANSFIQVIFGLKFNDTTNAFKAYRKEVIYGVSPLLSHHFNLTVEIPLKAIIRGYSYVTIPITWQNRKTGISKLKIKEMGSRYLFIVLYAWLEKHLSRGDYRRFHGYHLSEQRIHND
jgi:dolichol-phosphate mannosyltransferase